MKLKKELVVVKISSFAGDFIKIYRTNFSSIGLSKNIKNEKIAINENVVAKT